MRPDRFGMVTGDDDVRVSALRPRPLVKDPQVETALPPVGRPPRRRHGRTLALVAVGLLATVVVARIGFEVWARSALHTGGPVSLGGGVVGAPAAVGQPIAFSGFLLQNEAKTPAVLEDVRVVGMAGGFDVVEVKTSPVPRAGGSDGDTSGDQPSDSLAAKHVVPVETARPGHAAPEEGLRLIVTARATVPGVARARGVEVTYRVGHRRYRRSSDSSMYLCAPPEAFPGFTCPGHAEGQFGNGMADFPVRP
jgi:hypothetical protein